MSVDDHVSVDDQTGVDDVSLRTKAPAHADPAFPALHGRPARGWVNDPNGLCRIDGRYHVFFQHNPAAPVHGAIVWGHASSDDLVTWRQEPVAFGPRPDGPDAAGCWSGCLVDDDGTPTAVYSGIVDHSGAADVVLARSDRDLLRWDRTGSVMGMPDDPSISDVRDPFVVEVDGHRYAVQGAGLRGGGPKLLVYGCDDLERWTPLGVLLDGDHPVAASVAPAHIWECPNLFRLDGRWVLLVSLWRSEAGSFALQGVRYLVGDLTVTADGPRFEPAAGGLVDDGPAFYAPQVLLDGDRVLLWGWSWEHGRTPEQVDQAGWAGALTFPRELALAGDDLVSRPARELEALRGEAAVLAPGEPVVLRAFEVVLPAGASRLTLCLDGEDVDGVVDLSGPAAPQPVRVLVDGSLVEVFGAGARSVTTRAYPGAGSAWTLRWEGPGGATLFPLG